MWSSNVWTVYNLPDPRTLFPDAPPPTLAPKVTHHLVGLPSDASSAAPTTPGKTKKRPAPAMAAVECTDGCLPKVSLAAFGSKYLVVAAPDPAKKEIALAVLDALYG